MLIAAALDFFMQAGFTMVESGFTRAKNAGNIIMKNFMDFCGGTISYWIIGFKIMFGVSAGGFTGTGIPALVVFFRIFRCFPFPPLFSISYCAIISSNAVFGDHRRYNCLLLIHVPGG